MYKAKQRCLLFHVMFCLTTNLCFCKDAHLSDVCVPMVKPKI